MVGSCLPSLWLVDTWQQATLSLWNVLAVEALEELALHEGIALEHKLFRAYFCVFQLVQVFGLLFLNPVVVVVDVEIVLDWVIELDSFCQRWQHPDLLNIRVYERLEMVNHSLVASNFLLCEQRMLHNDLEMCMGSQLVECSFPQKFQTLHSIRVLRIIVIDRLRE